MRRELSTPYTFVYRWVIPALLTVVAIAAIWLFAWPDNTGRPETMGVIIGAGLALAAGVLARVFDRAKRVWVNGGELVVSDLHNEIRVDLLNVARVEALPFFWPHRLKIVYKQATRFGAASVFFPPLSFGSAAAVVAELERQLAPE